MTTPDRKPATGPGSNRYQRYEASGEDITTQPERANDDPGSAEAVESVEFGSPEERRAYDKQYNNLNMGIPTHRGADEKTHDAVVAGLHGRTRSDAEVQAEERRRYYGGQNHGTPLDSVGAKKEIRDRLKKAVADELEQE